ncbi:hypothetical protein BU25DRAFT_77605 [Macroventuria anomochaeta]|uniref:Uncharacterized protein n=1 Tax=Macroventuria anomochaeta TaxID=301207 RepID=A0ACB6SED4_9PLEO|nr:uncharacterized protein BU25DRAFT_77605 [Macroventuria anomochaeta]KAF2632581.1 hypothetical protein BU25DRAFT_77605 [Macroventuria anomochaeta]
MGENMLLEEETLSSCRTSDSPSPNLQKATMKIVYVVIDTCYATLADFDQGKGSTNIDSVHTTSQAANVRAKKVMFARTNPGDKCEIDQDKILEEIKDGLYTGIGLGGNKNTGCYAKKCEVEAKPIDIEDDGSSEEDHDGVDWNMG